MIFGDMFRWLKGIFSRIVDNIKIGRRKKTAASGDLAIARQRSDIDVTFVTYAELPQGDQDDLLALRLLKERGYNTQVAVWNDPAVDWSKAGLCILRSTWDYHLQQPTFIGWAEQLVSKTKLLNPIELIRWNSNKKTYMQDLARKGAPLIDTVWLSKGTSANLKDILQKNAWERAVLKPTIGCGTFQVKRVSNDPASLAECQTHLDAILATGDVMIQPYVTAVESYGERALTFINGKYSHATLKTPFQALLPTGQAGEQPVKATAKEIALAARIVALVKPKPLYARVDLIPDNKGRTCLLELELVEPSLFLSMDNAAPRRFADAIAALLGKPGSSKP